MYKFSALGKPSVAAKRLALFIGASLGAMALASSSAFAQVATPDGAPALKNVVDSFGLNLTDGSLLTEQPAISTAGLSRTGRYVYRFRPNCPDCGTLHRDDHFNEIVDIMVNPEKSRRFFYVSYNGQSEVFGYYNNILTGQKGSVNKLTCTTFGVDPFICTYELKDGTVVTYSNENITSTGNPQHIRYLIQSVVKPNGETLKYKYWKWTVNEPQVHLTPSKIKSVESNLGWKLLYDHKWVQDGSVYLPRDSARIINTSIDYCNGPDVFQAPGYYNLRPYEFRNVCTIANAGIVPTLKSVDTKVGNTYETTLSDVDGTTLMKIIAGGFLYPSGRKKEYLANVSYENWNEYTQKFISKVVMGPYQRTYSYVSDPDTIVFTSKAKDLDNKIFETVSYIEGQSPKTIKDEIARLDEYTYNADGLLEKAIGPEATRTSSGTLTGGYSFYEYDTRKNLKKVSAYPTGGGAPQVTTYGYAVDCVGVRKKYCDKVHTVTDPIGNATGATNRTTEYKYSDVHGLLEKVIYPADNSGHRPEIRYEYQPKYAKVKNDAGVLGDAATPVYLLTRESTCRTASASSNGACVSVADETVKTYEYYEEQNLLLKSVTTTGGDGSGSVKTSYGYDYVGNRIWIDGPLTDVDDRSYVTYDKHSRPICEIGVDPDGVGTGLARAIVKHRYDLDGREDRTEVGTGNSTDCSDFNPSSYTAHTFDVASGKVTKTVTGSMP